jgi:LysR family transcriptional activator of nhaA
MGAAAVLAYSVTHASNTVIPAGMSNLNFKHLRYFWAVATHGSIARASEVLYLTPQTISGQLRELEQQLNAKLLQKSGRNLVLTDTGRVVFSYADEMFRMGDELLDVLAGRVSGATLTLTVGVAMVVPKLLAYRVLAPVLQMDEPVRLICQEAPLADLLADLSVHKLDLVLADSPISPALNVRAYNHLLGESGISFFATRAMARRYSAKFPHSLNDYPQQFIEAHAGTLVRTSEDHPAGCCRVRGPRADEGIWRGERRYLHLADDRRG